MILSYQTIRRLCQEQKLIDPWNERTVHNGMSYGLGPCTYDFRLDKILNENNLLVSEYELASGEAILVSTIEAVNLPDYICASVLDKSSFARKFMSCFNTHFDPGFKGFPTIELVNLGPRKIRLEYGMPICQFKFELLDRPTEKPYEGKYQHQEARPVPTKLEVPAYVSTKD